MKPKFHLVFYTVFLLTIFVLAYFGLIPTELFFLPFFDSLGHFVLYGTWAYLCARVFTHSILTIGYFIFPAGILIITVIAVVEESFQAFFPLRTFSFFDMGWGILGILIACYIFNKRHINEEKANWKKDGGY